MAISLAAGSGAAPEICFGIVRKTVSEIQIRESDLDCYAAVAAAEKRRLMDGGKTVDGKHQCGALDPINILRGHLLLEINDLLKFGAGSTKKVGTQKYRFADGLPEMGSGASMAAYDGA